MKVYKKILLGITAISVAASVSVGVSAVTYNDIRDSETAFAVSLLDALDVVNGFPDGGFHPDEELTRAQFCKLAIVLSDMEDKLATASKRTLFSDVTGEHWAAAYVNLAFESGFIQGYGNGMFGPDDPVTYAQALTIALRLLGYTEAEIGNVYPDDYVRYAEKIELCEGIDCGYNDNITRSEAAILLVNMIDTDTRSGIPFYKALDIDAVPDALLLDSECMASDGRLNCVKLYVNGQTVWYRKSGNVDSSFVGNEGTALLDDDGKVLAFLPGETEYTVRDGILINNSKRTSDILSAFPYETVIYADGELVSCPRAGTIPANLVGATGTLIINEDGYASAFVPDGLDNFSVIKNAVLVDDDTENDDGEENCALFWQNSKKVYYELDLAHEISHSDIGKKGTVLINADGYAANFVPEGDDYTVEYGVLTAYEKDTATFLIDGEHREYGLDIKLSSAMKGIYGIILVNPDGEVEAFIEDTDADADIIRDEVILLDTDCTSDDGIRHAAKFLENGRIVWYAQDEKLESDLVGCSGTLVLDEDKVVRAFYPDGTDYDLDVGVLLDIGETKAEFFMYGETVLLKLDDEHELSEKDIGSEGYILYSSYLRVYDFVPSEDAEKITLTDECVLLSSGRIAADGKTRTMKVYMNGKTETYRCYASVAFQPVGCIVRLILDEDGAVADCVYVSEGDISVKAVSADEGTLVGTKRTYPVDGDVTVIIDGGVSTWARAYSEINDGDTVYIYFDRFGEVDMIVVD